MISRASVLRYRGQVHEPRAMRRELAVRYMLTGSVRRAGDKVRLSAELCRLRSGTAIWNDRFACEAADLFELQDELVGPGGGDDRAAGAGVASCGAAAPSIPRASTPTNACCAGST